jgi:hypothetical protein
VIAHNSATTLRAQLLTRRQHRRRARHR